MSPNNDQNHKTYAIMPGMKMGMMTPDNLEKIASICRKFDVPVTKITGAQRLAFLGMEPEQLKALKKELHIPDTLPHTRNRVHYVQACPGSEWCKYGVGNSLALGAEIEKLELDGPLPSKVKVGISGCRMCCCGSWIRDVGLVSQKNGWRLIFGGNGAGRPRIGDIVAEGLVKSARELGSNWHRRSPEISRRHLTTYARPVGRCSATRHLPPQTVVRERADRS